MFSIIVQLLIAITLLNVWIVRNNKPTPYRGKAAPTLKDEFIAYGLPLWLFTTVGILKVMIAFTLVFGIANPVVIKPAAGLLGTFLKTSYFP